jgi:acetolactate synthase I/II/III large subunit
MSSQPGPAVLSDVAPDDKEFPVEPVALELVDSLRELGVSRVFALCGDHINPIYMACARRGVEVVSTRHEAAAVHMADAWARSTRQVGVALVNGGPGLANAVGGLTSAWPANSPVLLITGQVARGTADMGVMQELGQVEMARPVTKWARVVQDGRHIREYVAAAIRHATLGTPGPVYLSIPVDVLRARIDSDDRPRRRLESAPPIPRAGEREVAEIVRMLEAAERPVLLAGDDAYWARCDHELAAFVDAVHVPTFTLDMGRGLVPDWRPGVFGYGDPRLNPAAAEIAKADLVLLLGHNLDFRTDFGELIGDDARVVQVVRDPQEQGRHRTPDVVVLADMAGLLGDLAREGRRLDGRWEAWSRHLESCREAGHRAWSDAVGAPPAGRVHPLEVVHAARRWVTPDTHVVLDGGDFIHWSRALLRAPGPGRWVRLGSMSSLGAGLPFANAVQMAHPADRVLLFIGDGGFGFYGFELQTTVLHGLPVKIVLGNDGVWGTERRVQAAAYGDGNQFGVGVGQFPYAGYASLLGARGERVTSGDELEGAFRRLIEHDGPGLLEIATVSAGMPYDQR